MNFQQAVEFGEAIISAKKAHPLKDQWARIVRDMRVHMCGDYPKHLIDQRRPNEPPEVQEFRKSVYEPITMSVFEEATDGLYRIFIASGNSIKASDDLMNYLGLNNFDGTDFISWCQNILIPAMLVDPNAFALVWPKRDPSGQFTRPISPQIAIIESRQIVSYDMDYLFWLSDETVPIYSGAREYRGKVYYMMTDEVMIRFEQRTMGSTESYEAILYYTHGTPAFRYLPYVRLGGVPAWHKGQVYYESFFKSAVPFANDCVKQYSDWYASLVTASYAIREVRPTECDAIGCEGGKIWNEDRTSYVKCHKCHGTGYVPSFSPYGIYVQGKDDLITGEQSKPPIIYHTPPIEPLQYSERAWQEMYRRLRQALHLEYVDEAQSGVAKHIDREPAYAQLLRISNHVWDSIIWTLVDIMERMRNPSSYREPGVIKPSQFSMRSQNELMDEIAKLRNAKAPSELVLELLRELIKIRYAGDELLLAKHNFLIMTDPLYDMDPQQKALYYSAGLIDADQINYNLWAGSIIDEIQRAVPDPLEIYRNPEALRLRIIEIARSRSGVRPSVPELA